MNQILLVELLTEELPPKALAKLGDAFAAGIFNGLKSRDFLEADSVATAFATPRRLAVSITNVRDRSPDKSIREKVLPVSVALDAGGQPSAPLIKKLAALAQATKNEKLTVDALERAADGKADSFFYTYSLPGSLLGVGLQAALEEAIGKLPIPKLMSYQRPDGSTVQFVRPVHKLIALHGSDLVPLAILGLQAGRSTLGHRFLSSGELVIEHADHYASALAEKGKVIASINARKEKIRAALLAQAGDDKVLMPDSLLDEVAALVEWPVVYACKFEEEFLAVPQECLILTMQTNQKYFALTDANGKLRSRFLIVSNIETGDPQHIIGGNERVVRPRLSDAKFFFEQDKKSRLDDRLIDLPKVIYHNKLGSQGDRSERVEVLAGKIAEMMGSDVALARRGARLAKTDLLTNMVGEFPELQGIMGTYYARNDGEPEEVALAMSEHYQPRFAGDTLPTTRTGTAVALADKLETLVGIWSIGLQPTGDRDPFALRRHALGVLRMLIEQRLPLSIGALLGGAKEIFDTQLHTVKIPNPTPGADHIVANTIGWSLNPGSVPEITIFLFDRLRGLLRERGYSPNEVEAVVSQNPDTLDNIIERLNAVQVFAKLPEAEALAAANKRITNILKKVEGTPGAVDKDLLIKKGEEQEQALASAMALLKDQVDSAFDQGDYTTALTKLAGLRTNVDLFFDKVMVMAEDVQLRNNRIALLAELHGMMNRVADISKLAA